MKIELLSVRLETSELQDFLSFQCDIFDHFLDDSLMELNVKVTVVSGFVCDHILKIEYSLPKSEAINTGT